MKDRIVITGMGAISPIGNSVEDSWNHALQGVSGVAPITLFDADNYQVKIAAEVKSFQPNLYMSDKEARRRDRYQNFAFAAAQSAINQARLNEVGDNGINPERIGVVVASAVGGLTSLHEGIETIRDESPRRVSPFLIPMLMVNGAAGLIAIEYGFHGPSMSVGSACASSSDGLGVAWMMLQSGMVDVVVAGGSEATITPIGISAFDRLGALSRNQEVNPDGHYSTPKPFDRNRDGLVMGEGAAILVIERENHARVRGIPILAEFAGYSATSDAYHITAPAADGGGGARAIRNVLEISGIHANEVDYINAHGTATILNDISETRAIKTVFGKRAYNIPVSSTKSMTGHMMGATGALEAIFSVLAIRDATIPPTINYQEPDPECDLDYVPNESRRMSVRTVISNSFGFGGHNSVIAIRQYA
jgi:3-oxoacyl-[acyl-carrier-protein] synthase II